MHQDRARWRRDTYQTLKNHLRRLPLVKSTYQNLRFAVFSARHRLAWRSRAGDRKQPHQALRTFVLPHPVRDVRSLLACLDDLGVPYAEGSHVLYLPPHANLERLVPGFTGQYPPSSAVKVLKDLRSPAEASYLTGPANHAVRRNLTGSPFDQARASNFLFVRGLAPRVWDVCEWRTAGTGDDVASMTAMVVEHVEGDATGITTEECRSFLGRLEEQTERGFFHVLVPRWQTKWDFRCPDCGGNLRRGADDALKYVDFQNFRVDAERWTARLVDADGQVTHFGGAGPTGRERYLYQAIPGIDRSSKRDSALRWERLEGLLSRAGVGVSGRVVVDVGCNAGMMAHHALAHGASWAVGLDRPEVARFAEEVLVALGSTRSSIVSVDLTPEHRLQESIPGFLTPQLGDAVVLYLAVRESLGILPCLADLPWRALVYEGHQGESVDDALRHLAPLTAMAGSTVIADRFRDGQSSGRPLVVVARSEGAAPR